MDLAADPRQGFRRYAGGGWLDTATIPADKLEISDYLAMQEMVQKQLQDAARRSGTAPQGSPAQQVGDF